jgi:PEP-CTERM motif
MKVMNNALIAAGVGAIVAVIGVSSAMADPVFTIDPTSIVPAGSAVQASDLAYYSNATIVQSTATTQTETGYAYITTITNNGATVDPTISRNVTPPYGFAPPTTTYGLYFTYTATVSGVTGFGPNAGVGTVTGFDFNLYADIGDDDTFNPGNYSTTAVTGNTANDVLLASGSLESGAAGFQAVTGAPTFSALDSFIVDDPAFFTEPNPFYNLVFTSTTAASSSDVSVNSTGTAATLNGINGGVNFVPEPLTLSLFGAGLVGAGALRRRKSKKKA